MGCERCKELEESNAYLLDIIESDRVSNEALRKALKSVEHHNDTLRNALKNHGEETAQAGIRKDIR